MTRPQIKKRIKEIYRDIDALSEYGYKQEIEGAYRELAMLETKLKRRVK